MFSFTLLDKYKTLFKNRRLNNNLNPTKLVLQIVCLQLLYYFSAFVLFFSILTLIGYKFELKHIFLWKTITLNNRIGFIISLLWLLNSILSVIIITLIIERSKLAWDFSLTVYLINLLITWIYTKKFPNSFIWWLSQISGVFILGYLSTYLMRWKELKITFFENII